MEAQLKDIDAEIKKVYNSQNANPYYLHAILVHQGTTDNGHYYSFILDKKANQWYRFNDYRVTPETELQVMHESIGDPLAKYPTCAYTLIYVNQNIHDLQMKRSLEEFNTAMIPQVPMQFVKEIEFDNKAFTLESTNFKVDHIVSNIIDLFKKRSDKLAKIIQTRPPHVELMNLNLFIM